MKKAVKLLGPVKIGAAFHKEGETVEVDDDVLGELEALGLVSIEAGQDAQPVLVEPEPGNAIQENVRAELELQLKAANARADHLAEARKALQDEAVKLNAHIDELVQARDEARTRGDVLAQEVAQLQAQLAAATAPAPKAKTTKA
jgi:hypothetical protein